MFVKPCSRRTQGFTLIEIMMVIAVIGILAIVTVPKYQAITDHYKLESSAQIVVGQLRYAQQLAMDRRQPTYMAMKTTSVQVSDDLNKVFGGIQPFDSGVNFTVLSGLTFDPSKANGLPYVQYNPRGFVQNAASANSSINIILSSVQTGRSVDINVELYTGNITIKW